MGHQRLSAFWAWLVAWCGGTRRAAFQLASGVACLVFVGLALVHVATQPVRLSDYVAGTVYISLRDFRFRVESLSVREADTERLRRLVLAYLRTGPDEVVDDVFVDSPTPQTLTAQEMRQKLTDSPELTARFQRMTPDANLSLRRRDMWALILAHLEGRRLALNVDQTAEERDRCIAQFVAAE